MSSVFDDPALSAYRRASGWDEASLLADIARRSERLRSDRRIGLDENKDHYIRARRDTGLEHEDRGMYQSGARRQEQNEVLGDYRRNAMNLVRDTGNSITDLYALGGWDLSKIKKDDTDSTIASLEDPGYWL